MIWRRYHRAGIPEYLARHYWWAYLSRPMVWFFDHRPVLNLILFGQYKRLMRRTLIRFFRGCRQGRVLQLTHAYGDLTPTLVEGLKGGEFHLMDIAPVQLQAARHKLREAERDAEALLARMNAECLAYADDSFDTVVIFFLLHELPSDVRQRVLGETMRVLKPGGRLLTVDYGGLTRHHPLHRSALMRGIVGFLEPYLRGFWREDLRVMVAEAASGARKAIVHVEEDSVFAGFYRVTEFRMQIDAVTDMPLTPDGRSGEAVMVSG